VMRCVLPSLCWMLWMVGSVRWRALEVLEVFEALEALELPEVIRCVLEVPEVMRCVLDTLCARYSVCLMVGSVSRFRNFRRGSFLVTVPQPSVKPPNLRR